MRSCVFDWETLKVEPKPHGARRAVFESRTATMDELECHVTTLNPGQAPHASHRHLEEELMIVKEGTLEVVQNGMTNRAAPGSLIFHASNDRHGLRNVNDTPATYYVIKFYPPGMLKPKPQ
jgi:quercetin dioxygenase-like cupin family protein